MGTTSAALPDAFLPRPFPAVTGPTNRGLPDREMTVSWGLGTRRTDLVNGVDALNLGVTEGSPEPEATAGLLAGVWSMFLLLPRFVSGVSLGPRKNRKIKLECKNVI
jgi:hypothetical protein